MIKQRTSNNRLKEVLSSTFVLNGGYLKKVGLDCYKEEEPNQKWTSFFHLQKRIEERKKRLEEARKEECEREERIEEIKEKMDHLVHLQLDLKSKTVSKSNISPKLGLSLLEFLSFEPTFSDKNQFMSYSKLNFLVEKLRVQVMSQTSLETFIYQLPKIDELQKRCEEGCIIQSQELSRQFKEIKQEMLSSLLKLSLKKMNTLIERIDYIRKLQLTATFDPKMIETSCSELVHLYEMLKIIFETYSFSNLEIEVFFLKNGYKEKEKLEKEKKIFSSTFYQLETNIKTFLNTNHYDQTGYFKEKN